MTRAIQQLCNAVETFWLRPYVTDVKLLNRRISFDGVSAGLEEVPPSVLTGDPFSLARGGCIAVLGINPAFPGQPGDVDRARDEYSGKNFDEHYHRRAQFFLEDDSYNQYNGGHFTKLGNRIGRCLFDPPIEGARRVFREKVLMLDLLPWWSVNADRISPTAIENYLADGGPENPLRAWQSLTGLFFEVLRPTALIINGSKYWHLAEALLRVTLREFQWGTTPSGRRRLARGGRMANGAPILMHMHLSRPGSPCSDALYKQLLAEWRATGL